MLWWTLLLLRWGPAQVRLDAIVELGRARNVRAVDPLISALRRDQRARSVIAAALGKIGDPRAADALMNLLLDGQPSTRSAAAGALGEVGDTRAAEPLAAVVTTDPVPSVCEAAGLALIRLGDARGIARGVPVLVWKTQRDAPRGLVHYQGIRDLIVAIGATVVEPLIELLQHRDQDVQEVAATTLVQVGDARAVEPLIALLQRGAPPVRLVAADALAKLGGSRAVEALVIALGDQDRQVRQIAANLLARSGPRAVEPLIVSLSADDPVLRREAANVLTSLRDVRALEPLIAATCDPNEDVRWAAGSALLAIGDRRAIEPLVHLLMRGDDVSSVYLQSLLATLQRTPHSVPVETLLDLRHLASVIGPTGRVDCSAFRQFAQEELTRRGIQS